MNGMQTREHQMADRPFLAYYAESRGGLVVNGEYDEEADVWVTNGQPLVCSNELVMDTLTFTKASGESSDRD